LAEWDLGPITGEEREPGSQATADTDPSDADPGGVDTE
jgi:hypothetical protein